MKKPISKRCGIGKSCEHYNPHDKVSGCKIFEDRNECGKSLQQRKKVAVNAQIKNKEAHFTSRKNKSSYNFERPSWAQDLGDEWDHYAWSGDDF